MVPSQLRRCMDSLCVSTKVFPWHQLWMTFAPTRVSFFMWEVTRGKVLTIDNLRRIGFCLIKWCYLCKSDGESVDHVFLHCLVARGLWSYVLCISNISWVMPRKVVDVLRC